MKHETITEAQHAIMDEIKMLDKDSESKHYMYTSAAFATIMIRPLMIKHGISKRKIESKNEGRWQNGIGVDICAVFRYQLVGITDPENLIEGVTYVDVPVSGSGKAGKSGDKSIYAAATTASKYADLDFLNLPMVEDVESYEQVSEIIEEAYSDNGEEETKPKTKKKTKSKKKKSKKKKKKSKKKKKESRLKIPGREPEQQEEPEPEPEEIPTNSSELNYADGVFDVINDIYADAGIEAVLEFTEGDTRNKVEELVDDLKEDAGWEDPDAEEEEYEEEQEAEADEEEGVGLNELDYDDPDVKQAIKEQIDLEDEEVVQGCFDEFTDPNQLSSFYAVLLDHAEEIGQEFAESFSDYHFDYVQELFEELDQG